MPKKYLTKFKTVERSPSAPHVSHSVYSVLGALIAISLIVLLSKTAATPLLIAPFGATCVLAFGLPDSPLAQPRNIIGGHLLTAILGLLCYHLMGNTWYSLALGVSLSIGLMQITRTVHPPAGANPLVIILSGASWSFLFSPVLIGSVVLVAIALIFNNLSSKRKYPKYWF
ncbi:HPP family protein [Solitalea sp. MAHUQ-68]|uniref:HPP family protein n=1 Tax=Solitalea agri TaxID=2953739 RepID=A0A9X2F3F8_9SPHI|nr:HPP family protein [Solitalea agri]MCO4291661.1 HPP family protein [Solitalea agri]